MAHQSLHDWSDASFSDVAKSGIDAWSFDEEPGTGSRWDGDDSVHGYLDDDSDSAFDDESAIEAPALPEAVEEEPEGETPPPPPVRVMRRRRASVVEPSDDDDVERTRGASIVPVAATRVRRRGLGKVVGALLATLVVVGLLLVHVWARHRVVNLGYELCELSKDREALLEENRRLRIELRILTRADRLAPLADRQLGLVEPAHQQILYVTSEQLPLPTFTAPASEGER